MGRNFHKLGVTTPGFRDHAFRYQLVFDAVRISGRLVALVDGDNDRYFRSAGVHDRVFSLRPHAIIGGDYQENSVRRLGSAGAHGGKRGVAGGIQEGNFTTAGGYAISTDMLSN